MSNDEDRRIDDLRAQLKALGYLDSRLERFFLADAAGPGGFGAANLKSALRLGGAGGLLLGALLTLAALGAAPELAREPADALVLGAVFAVFAALAIAAAEFVLGLALRVVADRGWAARLAVGRTARLVGVGFGLATLAYLSLWWRSNAAGSLDEGPTAALAVAALGLLAALALGRFAALASFAVLARLVPARGLSAKATSWKTTAALVAAGGALYAGVFAALVHGAASPAPRPASPYRVAERPYRVVLVGIDGWPAALLEDMLERGEAPGLAALRRRGAYARLTPPEERVPSVVWTSIATGRPAREHGIRAIAAERLPGLRTPVQLGGAAVGRALASLGAAFRFTEPRPVGTTLRRVKALWEIVSDDGHPVGVVGWWASWPAEPVAGYLLTDRLFFKLREGGPYERETDDPETFARLAARWEEDAARARESLGSLVDAARRAGGDELVVGLLRDAYHWHVGEWLRREREPVLAMTYLSGLDVAAGKLLADPSSDPARIVRTARLLEDAARWIDGRLAALAGTLGPDDVLLVVADPGRLAAADASRGFLLLSGGPARAGRTVPEDVSAYAVAPTVLHLLGFPASAEMAAAPVAELFEPAWAAAHPPERIETYGERRVERIVVPSRFDREMLEQLRSLGYIQ